MTPELFSADTIIQNATLYNPFTCDWEETTIAIRDGIILGFGPEYRGGKILDLKGWRIVPGLIDAHLHIESSLLTPAEYARLVLSHGTTTVIADPHEIANVAGIAGIQAMICDAERTPLDIFYMLPSCVPATPMDSAGATLLAGDLSPFLGNPCVIGLGEMMNVPGVLNNDPDVLAKLRLCGIIDGHAPMLSGALLDRYIRSGIQSDHECITCDEARDKLRKGMYIFMREGAAARNLRDLAPLADCRTAPRCAFATDDRHADMLDIEGSIDDCIRIAVESGMEFEVALRMATLTPAERFGLHDRGALAPGRLADFIILEDSDLFSVGRVFKRGVEIRDLPYSPPAPLRTTFHCRLPDVDDLKISGAGPARVIGIIPGQITTRLEIRDVIGLNLPDIQSDIQKAVVCDRYRAGGFGIGLVHGFGLIEGALAVSVSHDSHNIVALGAEDSEIVLAIKTVASHNGAMVVASQGKTTVLPLPWGGIMSDQPYPDVVASLKELDEHARLLGAIENPFMYLSFLALTVIPELRLTERGLFDNTCFARTSLFIKE
ncbi:MAG: Adenine deaminase [Methanomicrobiales archaeon 53_19]|nr:MAG: Adenine deaminase [Methanocalculus sp. 52_23]KUL03450.1 MAG: Adenine deaminase [Methanomicrobiales archaeon 53_19]HIJ07719.1 adenine deaminase [Methanocalculus sp.]